MEKSKAIEWMSNRDLARKHFNDIVKDFNLLEEKDSPNDKGQEAFEQLYKERFKVRW